MSRGRALLVAQRPGKPLGAPPTDLGPAEISAWHDLVAAAPDVLRESDRFFLANTAMTLADWRSGLRDYAMLRNLYRFLGDAFIPMGERRRLLFPDKCRRR